jgi:hypothetical protein
MTWVFRILVAVCVSFLAYELITRLLVPILALITFPIAHIVASFLAAIALVLAILIFFVWLFIGHNYWPLKGRTF